MSTLRHRYRLVIDGTKHEIVTSARDMAAAQVGPGTDLTELNMADATLRLLHAACIRLGIPDIPSDWQDFADLLDDIDDLEPEATDNTDPTHAAGSDTPP